MSFLYCIVIVAMQMRCAWYCLRACISAWTGGSL